MKMDRSSNNVVADPMVADPPSPLADLRAVQLAALMRSALYAGECFEDLLLDGLGQLPEVPLENLRWDERIVRQLAILVDRSQRRQATHLTAPDLRSRGSKRLLQSGVSLFRPHLQ